MPKDIYENWWTSSDGKIYYRGHWYDNEDDLNSSRAYIVSSKILCLGNNINYYKYQHHYYLIGDEYLTYEQAHARGYSKTPSDGINYISKQSGDTLSGYYNKTDGYFVDGVWYDDMDVLNSAYAFSTSDFVAVYRKYELYKLTSLSRDFDGITKYYIFRNDIDDWISLPDLSRHGLSLLPSVELNWNTGTGFSNNVGHGGHSQNSSNLWNVLRNGTTVSLSDMDNLVGYVSARAEYNCTGALVGSYKAKAAGEKIYFEAYNGGSSSTRENLIISFYTDTTSSDSIYNYSYTVYQRMAVCNSNVGVVKIYNDCNNVFSAFKAIYNNETHYFVCDGVEREWIVESELNASGFSLTKHDNVLKLSANAYTDNLELPIGYKIRRINSCYAWAFPAGVSSEDGVDIVSYSLYGHNFISPYMCKKSASANYPVLYVLQGNSSSSKNALTGNRYTASYNSNSQWSSIDSVLTETVDSDNYKLTLKGNSDGYISSASSGYPAWFALYETYQSNALNNYDCFEVPSSLYQQIDTRVQFNGDIDSTSDLAYYYYGQQCNVYAYTENEADTIKPCEMIDLITSKIIPIEFWPHDGYKYNSKFYTKEELLDIGYHVISHNKEVNVKLTNYDASYISAKPNLTSKSTSTVDAIYKYELQLNGEPFLYDGSASIIVKNHKNRIYDLPDNTVSNSRSASTIHIINSANGSVTSPLKPTDINLPLSFTLGSTYYTAINYTNTDNVYSDLVLCIDDFKLPVFSNVTLINLKTERLLNAYYSDEYGYLIKNVGTYKSVVDLLDLDYYPYDVSMFSVYKAYFDSTSLALARNFGITKNSTSFAMTNSYYNRTLYYDSAQTNPIIYNGNPITWDLVASQIDAISSEAGISRVQSLDLMPDSTTSYTGSRTDLLIIVSENGTPLEPFKESDIGKPVKIYIASNYTGDIYFSTAPNCYIKKDDAPHESWYLKDRLYDLTYITINDTIYYRSTEYGGYHTKDELINLGYSKTPSYEIVIANTDIEFNIIDPDVGLLNTQLGYYYNGKWYSTVKELNDDGYYIVEKSTKTIYGRYDANYNYAITSKSTSFYTSYKKPYYLDSAKKEPFLWDGHRWIIETEYPWVNALSKLPSETTSNVREWKFLVQLITASGDPVNPFIQSEIGTQVYLYAATNYYTTLSTSDNSTYYQFDIYYWKLV